MTRGGSSLTQQLAKLMFLTPERSLRRKMKEAVIALHLERTYRKQEILTFYCNHVPWATTVRRRGGLARLLRQARGGALARRGGADRRPAAGTEPLPPYPLPGGGARRRDHVLDRMAAEAYGPPRQPRPPRPGRSVLKRFEPAEEATLGAYFVEEVRQHLEEQLRREAASTTTG